MGLFSKVTGERDGASGGQVCPPVAKQREQLDETVGSVDFVDADTPAIQTRHVDNLVDALKDVPGVFAQERFGQEIRLSIRALASPASFICAASSFYRTEFQ